MIGLLVMCVLIVACNALHAQDIIIKRDGKEIPSKVLEISSTEIKYKDFDFLTGPTRVLNISEVVVILYENGKREVFAAKDVAKTPSETVSNENEVNDKGSFIVGIGAGNSYGVPGVRLQMNTAREDKFGFHAGIGAFPNIDFIVSAGVKYYTFKDVYFNLQFGTLGYVKYISIVSSSIFYEYNTTYGPSFLIGGDWAWDVHRSFGLGINAGVGLSYEMNTRKEFAPAFDLGLIFKFY